MSIVIVILQLLTLAGIYKILRKERVIMSELDDLKAAVSDEATAITDLTTEVDAAVTKITTPGISAAEVEAAAQAIASGNASIRASAKKIADALTPPTT